eukprot:gene18569-18854_t
MPPRLSQLSDSLTRIEDSGLFSNYGPVNTELEQSFIDNMFGGTGACVTVCNATIGLMLALKHAKDQSSDDRRKYAILPSFTFAATAHAALWAGLTPVFCDVDEKTWLLDETKVETILKRLMPEVAVIMPYATFGNNIDLKNYDILSEKYNVPIVVDAAASLGSLNDDGSAFGVKSRHAIIYSMHATKSFSTGEAGLIYSENREIIDKLRVMGNFGFGQPRIATMAGLNSKLSEVGALLALEKLRGFENVVIHRAKLAKAYCDGLPDWTFQHLRGKRIAHQFMPVMVPDNISAGPTSAAQYLAEYGVASARYFSPILSEHPYFQKVSMTTDLPASHMVSSRIISLPLSDIILAQLEAIDNPRIKLIAFSENRGACEALNAGILAAKSPFIAICNSDDVWENTKLEIQLAEMERAPHISAIFSAANFIDLNGNALEINGKKRANLFKVRHDTRHGWMRHLIENGNCLCHPSIIIKREVYDKIGLYDNRYRQLPDLDMWLRLLQQFEIDVIAKPTINFRLHDNTSAPLPANSTRDRNEFARIAYGFFKNISETDFHLAFGTRRDPSSAYFNASVEKIIYLLSHETANRSIFNWISTEIAMDLLANNAGLSAWKAYGLTMHDFHLLNGMGSPWISRRSDNDYTEAEVEFIMRLTGKLRQAAQSIVSDMNESGKKTKFKRELKRLKNRLTNLLRIAG